MEHLYNNNNLLGKTTVLGEKRAPMQLRQAQISHRLPYG
jgi:hypothetical protein